MPRKGRQLKADLRNAGFVVSRQSGSHVTWKHVRFPDVTITLAIGDSEDAAPYEETLVRRAMVAAQAKEQGAL